MELTSFDIANQLAANEEIVHLRGEVSEGYLWTAALAAQRNALREELRKIDAAHPLLTRMLEIFEEGARTYARSSGIRALFAEAWLRRVKAASPEEPKDDGKALPPATGHDLQSLQEEVARMRARLSLEEQRRVAAEAQLAEAREATKLSNANAAGYLVQRNSLRRALAELQPRSPALDPRRQQEAFASGVMEQGKRTGMDLGRLRQWLSESTTPPPQRATPTPDEPLSPGQR